MLNRHSDTTAVILAAGLGSRMGDGVTKQRRSVGGKSVLARTLLACAASELIRDVVLVVREEEFSFANHEAENTLGGKPFTLVAGGETRQLSALAGAGAATGEYIAIHDAARCLIAPADIDRVIRVARENGAASAVAPVYDTVKQVSDGWIVGTLDRTQLRLAATPQVFRRTEYLAAARTAMHEGVTVTDDNALMEYAGISVRAVEPVFPNIKITVAADIAIAEAILKGENRL